MVAGDSKRIVVIKNISSNLIEEAILILKGESDGLPAGRTEKLPPGKAKARNDCILKEAEYIINEYIREHGLVRKQNTRMPAVEKKHLKLSVDTVINVLLTAAILLLLFSISKFF